MIFYRFVILGSPLRRKSSNNYTGRHSPDEQERDILLTTEAERKIGFNNLSVSFMK